MNIKLLIFTTVMIVTVYTISVEGNEQSVKRYKNRSVHNNYNHNNNRNKNHERNINTRSGVSHQSATNNKNPSRRNLKDQTHCSHVNSNQYVDSDHNNMKTQHNSNGRNQIHHNKQNKIKPIENNHEMEQDKREQLNAELEKLGENIGNVLNKYHQLQIKMSTTTKIPSTTTQHNKPRTEAKLADWPTNPCQTVIPGEHPSAECLPTIEDNFTTALPLV
ncbi:hypothetical protein DOY81_001206 [Sarcophaga bullata]|nr:hypothetical protein DOY81_001206 [Sarcophaga bullata]